LEGKLAPRADVAESNDTAEKCDDIPLTGAFDAQGEFRAAPSPERTGVGHAVAWPNYIRDDGATMVSRDGSTNCFVNEELKDVHHGERGHGGQLRLAALPPSASEPRDWPDGSFPAR
jgi:hypothetical protein